MLVPKAGFKVNLNFNNKRGNLSFGTINTKYIERLTLEDANNILQSQSLSERLNLLSSVVYTEKKLEQPKYLFLFQELKRNVETLFTSNLLSGDFETLIGIVAKNIPQEKLAELSDDAIMFYDSIIEKAEVRLKNNTSFVSQSFIQFILPKRRINTSH